MNQIARLGKSLGTHGLSGTLRLAAGLVIRPILKPLQRWWVSQYLRVSGRRFDRQFNVDTSGWIDGRNLDGGDSVPHATAYAGVLPTPFRDVMDQLKIDFEEFVFVDFGSGKGRPLMLASEYPFAKIVGLEFSPQLHECAEANCRSYRNPAQKCKNFELHCIDAIRHELPNQPAVLFFFNPFGEEIMRPVAEMVRATLRAHPRQMFVVYFWPVARKVWDSMESLVALPVRQPAWAWPAHRGREIVAVWSAATAT